MQLLASLVQGSTEQVIIAPTAIKADEGMDAEMTEAEEESEVKEIAECISAFRRQGADYHRSISASSPSASPSASWVLHRS